jgi:hypothetical protein
MGLGVLHANLDMTHHLTERPTNRAYEIQRSVIFTHFRFLRPQHEKDMVKNDRRTLVHLSL